MHRPDNAPRNWLIFALLLIVIMLVVGTLVFIAATVGVVPAPQSTWDATLAVSPLPSLEATPVERFAAIDPRIANVLDIGVSNYGRNQLDAFSIQPVGIYLPRTGDTQFEFQGPTPLPTPLPFPTSPPLPVPPVQAPPALTARPASQVSDIQQQTNQIAPPITGACAPQGFPVDGILTQRYHRYHSGVDLAIPMNTPVIATHSGQVTYADWSSVGYGYLVILQSGEFISYYAHNTSFNVQAGDAVDKGSILAFSGSTGNSSGPHVHYETRLNDIPVDPLTFSARGYQSC